MDERGMWDRITGDQRMNNGERCVLVVEK